MKYLGRIMAGFYILGLIFSMLSLSGCIFWVHDRGYHHDHWWDRDHDWHHEEHHDDYHGGDYHDEHH